MLHPGSAKQGDVGAGDQARRRGDRRRRWPRPSAAPCTSRTPPAPAARSGARFEELAALIEAAGGGPRLGVCLDSCHLLASGYDIRTADGLTETLDEFDAVVGLERLGSLHLNDSQTPLGSNRDRHARIGEGELGERGCAAFLSEPRFEELPVRARDRGHSGRTQIELCQQAAQARPGERGGRAGQALACATR